MKKRTIKYLLLHGRQIILLGMGVWCLMTPFGCSRLPPKPNDLPELYPCTVEVAFGGEKINDVSVILIPEDKNVSWGASGKTDAEGLAQIKTGMYYSGVPQGKYKIAFVKTIPQEGKRSNKLPKPPLSVIPLEYSPGKSQLTLEVNAEQSHHCFELKSGRAELW
jgi:hypothetical protein